jgi:hypothetical protein
MPYTDAEAREMRIKTVLLTMTEYQRRIYLSAEAKSIGYGGISLVSRLSWVSRQTLTEGVKELDDLKPKSLKLVEVAKLEPDEKRFGRSTLKLRIFSLNLLNLIQKVTLCDYCCGQTKA